MKTGCEIVVDYLQSVPAWYLATCEGDQPHVRPFSFAAHHEGRIWFCTSTEKDVYAEMKANPRIEISAWKPMSPWLVVQGFVDLVAEPTEAIQRAGFAHLRALGESYSGSEDPRLAFFSLIDGKAWLCDIDGSKLEVEMAFDYDSVVLPEDQPEAPIATEALAATEEDLEERFAEENFTDVG